MNAQFEGVAGRAALAIFACAFAAPAYAAEKAPADTPLADPAAWQHIPHAEGTFAVDATGERVAVAAGGGWNAATIAVHSSRDGKWTVDERKSRIPVRQLYFARGELEVNLGLDRPDELRELLLGAVTATARCGDLIVVGGPGGVFGLANAIRKGTSGWEGAGTLNIESPTQVTVLHSAFACHGDSIVAFVAPHDARCAVLEFERRDGAWRHAEPWFPDICPAPGDVGGIAVDYDGARLLVGAYPATGKANGLATIYARQGAQWVEQGEFAPPPDEAADAGQGAFFGGRVALGKGHVFIAAGHKRILESSPGYESSTGAYDTVYIFAGSGTTWTSGQNFGNDAGSQFGAALVVRDKRLFVGAPDGRSLYVFEFRDGAWKQLGQIGGAAFAPP